MSPRIMNVNGQMFVDTNDGTGGRAQISDNDPLRATYAAFIPSFAPAATPTDIMQLTGSASKTIRLRLITVTGTATAASNIILNLVRRSTLSTGAGSTPTVVTRDSADDAPSATLQTFSANPTLGTSAGIFDGGRLNIAPAANGSIDRLIFQYSWYNDKAPVLRTANDAICLNLGGAAWPSGGVLDVSFVWSEDTFVKI